MWHFKKLAFQTKWTVEPMNRYLIPINMSSYNSHVHKKRNAFCWIESVLRWLSFLFRCSKLHSELSWRNKMDGNYGKKVHCPHKARTQNACKFYFMHLNLHNKSWMWCGRTENVPLSATSSNNWLQFDAMKQKTAEWKPTKSNFIQFSAVFFHFLVQLESFIPCYLLKLSSYYTKWIFSALFRRNLHKSATKYATHCACISSGNFPLTKLKLHLSAKTTNAQRFARAFATIFVSIRDYSACKIVTFAFYLRINTLLWKSVVHSYFFSHLWALFFGTHLDGISHHVFCAISL